MASGDSRLSPAIFQDPYYCEEIPSFLCTWWPIQPCRMAASPVYENVLEIAKDVERQRKDMKRRRLWSDIIDKSRMISFTKSPDGIDTDNDDRCSHADPWFSSGKVSAYDNGNFIDDFSNNSKNKLQLSLDLQANSELDMETATEGCTCCFSPNEKFANYVANSPMTKKLREFGFTYPGQEEQDRRRSLHCAIVVLFLIIVALVLINAIVPILLKKGRLIEDSSLSYINAEFEPKNGKKGEFDESLERIFLITGDPIVVNNFKMKVPEKKTTAKSQFIIGESIKISTTTSSKMHTSTTTTTARTTSRAKSTTKKMTTTWPSSSLTVESIPTCASNQFKCRTGKSRVPCLYKWERCDGIVDCSDGSDELYCDKLRCYGNFQCKSGKKECVALDKVCNGVPDCDDNSDETVCKDFQCQSYEFRCNSGYCIPNEWICDGEVDCFEHEEEHNCSSHCSSNEFLCPEGWCIPESWKCNGIRDCSKGQDEANCSSTCPWLKCKSGQCILLEKQCDGNSDCPDGSDEWGCEQLRPDGQVELIRGNDTGILCFDDHSEKTADRVCRQYGLGAPLRVRSVYTHRQLFVFENDGKTSRFCPSNKAMEIRCRKPADCGVWHPTLDGEHRETTRRKRMVGGHISGRRQWPSVALLFHKNRAVCTASVLANNWLATSALCVRRIDENPDNWRLIAGNAHPKRADNSTILAEVANFVIHPSYKFRTMAASYGILLVELKSPLSDNDTGSICRPPKEKPPASSFCVTAGWGYTNPGGYFINKQLRHLEMKLWNSQSCNSSEHYHNMIDSTMICAGAKVEHSGPCFNDEGSPLMCHDPHSGRWYLAGILTTHSCGGKDHPVIFADTSAQKDWISHIVFHSAPLIR